VKDPTQARRDTFEDVCEKFNIFLVHQYQRGYPTKGLLLIDEIVRLSIANWLMILRNKALLTAI
jgi:hypothetical protein